MLSEKYPSFHYVYVTFKKLSQEFYVGCRTCKFIDPLDDVEYLGSGEWVRAMIDRGFTLEKVILKTFPCREEAERVEELVIRKMQDNPYLMNLRKRDCKHPAFPRIRKYKSKHGGDFTFVSPSINRKKTNGAVTLEDIYG